MTESQPKDALPRRSSPLGQVRVWHLSLLVLFVAVAIVNIQDQRRTEPFLIGVACGGFVLYALIGWFGWRFARKLEPRLGKTAVIVFYLIALAVLFLVATVMYVMIEIYYLTGHV